MRQAQIKADAALHRTWNSWRAMRSRCERPGDINFHRYGGRGIKVCPQWASFDRFLADMGTRPEGKTLDRFPDRAGNYEPANCRWATYREQVANSNQIGPLIEFQGRTQCVHRWALELHLGKNTIHKRLARGWSIERALTTPGVQK